MHKKISNILYFLINYLPTCINYFFNNSKEFAHKLSVVAILKNEAEYILEWIEYHKLVGVEKFYLYDNGSTDNVKELLAPYIENGEVEYIFYPGKFKQIPAYKNALKKYRNNSKWMAFIDIDEFIVPLQHEKIIDVMDELEPDAGLVVSWDCFLHNGHYKKPLGLVIENFTKSSGVNKQIKSIVNPRTAVTLRAYSPHAFWYILGKYAINENKKRMLTGAYKNIADTSIDKIKINHYLTKSYEESVERSKGGNPHKKKRRPRPVRKFDAVQEQNDFSMDKYVPLIKESLQQ